MLPLKPPYNILQFINILHLQNICAFRDMDPISTSIPHIFWTSKFELLDLMNPKIWTLQIPSWSMIPKPKINQKIPKDPKLIPILTMKQVYTYFQKTLPIGDLILLTDFTGFFQKLTNQIKLLKSQKNTSKDATVDLNL